jgi:hypothetical protein
MWYTSHSFLIMAAVAVPVHSILSHSVKYLVFSQKIHTVVKNLHRSQNKVTGITIRKDLLAYFPYFIFYLDNSWAGWQMLIKFGMNILALATTSSICQQGRCVNLWSGLRQHQHHLICGPIFLCGDKKCNLCYSFLCNTNIAVIQNLCLCFSIMVINNEPLQLGMWNLVLR